MATIRTLYNNQLYFFGDSSEVENIILKQFQHPIVIPFSRPTESLSSGFSPPVLTTLKLYVINHYNQELLGLDKFQNFSDESELSQVIPIVLLYNMRKEELNQILSSSPFHPHAFIFALTDQKSCVDFINDLYISYCCNRRLVEIDFGDIFSLLGSTPNNIKLVKSYEIDEASGMKTQNIPYFSYHANKCVGMSDVLNLIDDTLGDIESCFSLSISESEEDFIRIFVEV